MTGSRYLTSSGRRYHGSRARRVRAIYSSNVSGYPVEQMPVSQRAAERRVGVAGVVTMMSSPVEVWRQRGLDRGCWPLGDGGGALNVCRAGCAGALPISHARRDSPPSDRRYRRARESMMTVGGGMVSIQVGASSNLAGPRTSVDGAGPMQLKGHQHLVLCASCRRPMTRHDEAAMNATMHIRDRCRLSVHGNVRGSGT